jgi:alpha-tubulin suppressor-like RCC1 family protein
MKTFRLALLLLVAGACTHAPTSVGAPAARVLPTLSLYVGQSAQIRPGLQAEYNSVPGVSSSAVAFVEMYYDTVFAPEGPGVQVQVFVLRAAAPGETVVTIRSTNGTPDVQDTINVQAGVPHGAFAQVNTGFTLSTCAVTTQGGGYCWGSLATTVADGNGAYARPIYDIPGAVPDGLNWAGISIGGEHACGLAADGAAYCWGANYNGQLGNGGTTGSSAPMAVAGGLKFKAVAAGVTHTCGLAISGAAYCWGNNVAGQLGNGATGYVNSTPVAVSGGLTFATVAAGNQYSCGLTTSGAAYCWGENDFGELGTGDTTFSLVPVAVSGALVFVALSTGFFHACGLARDGTAYCWGGNFAGELGNGSAAGPQQCAAGGASYSCSTVPVAVTGGLTFSSMSAGQWTTCGVATGGRAYCWGSNGYGQLGYGTSVFSLNPNPVPGPVAGGLTFASVGTGYLHTCGVTPQGAAYCWGDNSEGELGNGSTTVSTSPVLVSGP